MIIINDYKPTTKTEIVNDSSLITQESSPKLNTQSQQRKVSIIRTKASWIA